MHRYIFMEFSEVLLNNPLTKTSRPQSVGFDKCRNTETEYLESKRWVNGLPLGFFLELICLLVLSFEKNTTWVSG